MSSENDNLSRLPEEIVTHILSLTPTKFAVRTSILAKRWRYRWMLVTNIDIDDTTDPFAFLRSNNRDLFRWEVKSARLIEFVDRVLEFCKPSQVKVFRLHICKTSVPSYRVSKWIDKAVRLNVCELDIHYGLPSVVLLNLPLNLLTCKTLAKLRLDDLFCALSEGPCVVNLPCLKTLVLIRQSFVNASKLISGSPALECLSLRDTRCDEYKEDFIFNIPTLKRLELTLKRANTSCSNKVVLNVPNLEYLFVGGELCKFFSMENMASLIEACISFDNLRFDHRWFEFLKGLIESSPQLKHLCIEKTDEHVVEKPNPEQYAWIELALVPVCMLTTLTTIKFLKCEGHKRDIKFLKYMLANAKVLKTVTITWQNLEIEENARLCVKLLAAPRASRYCDIYFLD